jgi:hypothetical protein
VIINNQPRIFFILTTTFSKKLCDENWNDKSDYDFQAFFFVVMAPALGSIEPGGSPSGGGGGFLKSPRERDTCRLEYYFFEDFMKYSGAKITRYPFFNNYPQVGQTLLFFSLTGLKYGFHLPKMSTTQ